MEPMTAMLLGSAITGGAGLLSSNAANKTNFQTALMNYYAQQQARRDQTRQADRMWGMQTAPVTDARGNTTQYIPGVGWTSTPSEQTSKLLSASDAEELRRLTLDAAMRRRGMDANEARRMDEGDQAQQYLDRLNQGDRYSPAELESLLLTAATTGIDRGFNDAQQNALRQDLRSGHGNAGQILAAMAARRADAYKKAGAESKLNAILQSENLNRARTSDTANLYNMFATRASNFDDTAFAPTAAGVGMANQSARSQALIPQVGGQVMNAYGTAPQFNYQAQPSQLPQLLGSMTNAYSGMLQANQDQQYSNDLLSALKNRQMGNQSTGTRTYDPYGRSGT